MFNTLITITKELKSKDIKWALGGSWVLYHHQLIEEVNDIDIIVEEKDIDRIIEVMSLLGEPQGVERKKLFATKYFYKFLVNGINIDIMGGFGIRHNKGVYIYEFKDASITDYIRSEDVMVPVTSLEDWFVLYQLLPNREYKVDLIEKYLLEKGNIKVQFLNEALKKSLPKEVTERIVKLIQIFHK